jgi:hypothetical protein
MTEPCWLAQQNITEEKGTQREGKTPYETNKRKRTEKQNEKLSQCCCFRIASTESPYGIGSLYIRLGDPKLQYIRVCHQALYKG